MRHVHFIGVCGVGMATLAAMLRQRGDRVTGSDQSVYPPMSEFLVREGITILGGYRAEHIPDGLDLVVVGNAISRGNPELEEVLDRKIRYASMPEVVRSDFLWDARSIVITGTHGKTTTAALAAWVLASGGRDPSALIGGIVGNFGSGYRVGAGREFVIEGDEYDSAFFDKTAKFLKYLPDIAVVNNVEFDHADIYPDLEAIMLAFRRFARLVPRRGLLLLGGDDPQARSLGTSAHSRVETFGLDAACDWHADAVSPGPGGTTFDLWRHRQRVGRFEMPLHGAHNVRNALAALAIGSEVGLSASTLADALVRFEGVKRRLERRGSAAGIEVFDDFAHHPTAIRESLAAVRAARPGARVWAVFEPRSATSCLNVFEQDFARAFASADETILAAVFRAAIPDDRRLDPAALAARLSRDGKRARYVPAVPDIVEVIAREGRAGDVVVVMSNGGFENIQETLLNRLKAVPGAPGA